MYLSMLIIEARPFRPHLVEKYNKEIANYSFNISKWVVTLYVAIETVAILDPPIFVIVLIKRKFRNLKLLAGFHLFE